MAAPGERVKLEQEQVMKRTIGDDGDDDDDGDNDDRGERIIRYSNIIQILTPNTSIRIRIHVTF